MKEKISIIIVTFNSDLYIERCINSILNSTTRLSSKVNITVIDNKSTDSTIKKIRNIKVSKDSTVNIRLIENINNFGFAAAVNQGIKLNKKSDYYLLLNPDTELKPNSIGILIECAINRRAGICGGKTVDSNGNESGSHFRFPNIMVGVFDFTNARKIFRSERWHNYFYYKDITIHNSTGYEVDAVTGGYMLIKRKTIENIGLFDQRFFMYLEDVDFCNRAKKRGIKVIHCEKSVITHVGGASSNNKDKIRHSAWLLSRKWYFIKHFGFMENILMQTLFLVDDILIIGLKLFKK